MIEKETISKLLVKIVSNAIIIFLICYGLCYAIDYPFGLKPFIGLYSLSVFIRQVVCRPYPKL